MTKLDLQIWSDIACPWCYVGKRRLEAALRDFPHRDAVEITWRAFELDPSAPRQQPNDVSYAARLADKYGLSLAQAEAMIASMTATAAADGIEMRFEQARAGNTFDAHRLIHFAAARGLGGAAKERLFRAYMAEGEAIGEPEVLVRLGEELGLEAEAVRAMLASSAGADSVRRDEAEAQAFGIRGVPFFLFDRRLAVSGAQPAEILRRALDQAWSERADAAPSAEKSKRPAD